MHCCMLTRAHNLLSVEAAYGLRRNDIIESPPNGYIYIYIYICIYTRADRVHRPFWPSTSVSSPLPLIMDPAKLKQLINNTYIPPRSHRSVQCVPLYHPCLIVQDSQTDVSKIKPCGCADLYCVKNAPQWIPQAKR